MKSLLHYTILFFIVTIGVAAGNLISNAVSAMYVDMALEKELSNLNKSLTESQLIARSKSKENQAKRKKEQESKKLKAMQMRDNSQLGQRLMRECEDWIDAKKNTPGYTADFWSKRKCHKYNTYISTGKLIND